MEKRILALERLGRILTAIGDNNHWTGFEIGITEEEYEVLNNLCANVKGYNGWFEEREVRRAFSVWGNTLTQENLRLWLEEYPMLTKNTKTIAIVMAGNIPLVGFHDFLSVYVLGHKMKIKLSSDDDKLLPEMIRVLGHFDAEINDQVEFVSGKLEHFDAVIATGSSNTALYFEQYFGKYPNIIRKNRTSVAVLTGNESKEELSALGRDVFSYYGLGCRNVTKLFLPPGYDLDQLFGAFYDFKYVVDNNKYANNYDYHKAIFLMEQLDFLENGFLLLKQDSGLHSPIGTLYYETYTDLKDVRKYLTEESHSIQCIVGEGETAFGKTQIPSLLDYADGVDTMDFLNCL